MLFCCALLLSKLEVLVVETQEMDWDMIVHQPLTWKQLGRVSRKRRNTSYLIIKEPLTVM